MPISRLYIIIIVFIVMTSLSLLSQVESSLSTGGSYLGYSGSVEVDVAVFNEEISESTEFGSTETTIAIGSTIEKNNGVYRTVDDGKPRRLSGLGSGSFLMHSIRDCGLTYQKEEQHTNPWGLLERWQTLNKH